MRAIHLRPVRRPAPTCDTYDSEEAVRWFERAVRLHRAYVEPADVAPVDGRADGAFLVTGANGRGYLVDIVDASGRYDTCACPDFLGNDLGTCKHVEAVRRAVASVPALRRGYEALRGKRTPPTLTVTAVGGLALRPVGAWSRAALARLGIGRGGGPALVPAGKQLVSARDSAGFRVVHAAEAAANILWSRRQLASRRREVRHAVDNGRLGFDVLAEPLFPYQAEGALHLVGAGRALLADDMGLGKTAQAIAACEVLRKRGEASRILVVTVASLKHQWAREIERFAGERAVVVAGGAPARRRALDSDAPYKILNYELTWRELNLLQSLDADVVIYDEAQRAKNFRTKTATTLRAIPARFVFVLTGTPVENRLDDLYSLMQLVDPDVLGPLWKFNVDFHEQNERGKIIGYKKLSELRRRIAPVVLRRRKEDVLTQLPALTEQTRYTAMSKEQIELEEGYRADAAILLSIAERRPLSKEEQDRLMMLLLKARQACDALELCDPKRKRAASPKLDEFEALVSEIAAQGTSKVLVFSEWVEMLKLAAARLDRLGIGYAMLHGGVPAERRPALLDGFRDSPDVRILLSTDAGGVGLNLQVATYVIHLDLPWNPGKLDQRTARAHRMGQTRGVSVTYLCAERGIEWGIEKTLAIKRQVRGAALDRTSDVDSIAAPSFTVFLRQLRDVLDGAQQPAPAGERNDDSAAAPEPSRVETELVGDGDETRASPHAAGVAAQPSQRGGPEAAIVVAGGGETPIATAAPPLHHGPAARDPRMADAHDRLRLARLVLDAGFTGDAVAASYQALAAAIAGLLGEAVPGGHGGLVAAIYRDLLPAGRLPAGAHGALARLNDLTSLQSQGIAVDQALAHEAVAEAEHWVSRLTAAPHTSPSIAEANAATN